jgi:ubiquinone/menaquinone biosynthesis C-methylase UbiE
MSAVAGKVRPRLRMLERQEYSWVKERDPLALYYWPVLGRLDRRRVELCLAELTGGRRVLEIGFGSGITFLNLAERYEEIHGLDLTADCAHTEATFRRHGIATSLRNGNVLEMTDYPDEYFDSVLLISILEHLKPQEQDRAFAEMKRVLKPGGQVVYGVPVERRLMVVAFRLIGCDIRKHHFSTEADVSAAASRNLREVRPHSMKARPSFLGKVYEVGHYVK